MPNDMPQAHFNGQIAEGLNAMDQAIVASAILAQEDKLAISRFAQPSEQTAKNDSNTNQSLSKFMTGVDNAIDYSHNQRKRSGLTSDSPVAEILQEVLELVEDLSYAAARRSAAKKQQSSFTTSRNMTTTSKFALSKPTKAQKKKNDAEIARLKELKTLHGEIKRALRNKHTISNEQVDKIKKGVIAMRQDLHKELGIGQSTPTLEATDPHKCARFSM